MVGSRYLRSKLVHRTKLYSVHTVLIPMLLILKALFCPDHCPTMAFKKYLEENPWAPEARMYEV